MPAIAAKDHNDVGPHDVAFIEQLEGETTWRIARLVSNRGDISNAREADEFGQNLGIYDKQFATKEAAYAFARQFIDANLRG